MKILQFLHRCATESTVPGVVSILMLICLSLHSSSSTAERISRSTSENESYHNYNYTANPDTSDDFTGSSRDFTLAFLTSVSNKGSGRHYGGAFFLAIEELNKMAKDSNLSVWFSWVFRDTGNKESRALKEMADLYCSQKISAFIGPDAYCKSAGLLATGFSIPYITFNCQDNLNDTQEHLFVNTETSFLYVSRFIASLLHHYRWKSFWLVTGQTTKWKNVAQQLKISAAARNISINGESTSDANDAFSPYLEKSNPYQNILQASRYRTRIYVFLGVYESLLMFLRELATLDMTSSGEYAVITADENVDSQSDHTFYLTSLETKTMNNLTEEYKNTQLLAFQNVLVVKPQMTDVNREEFEDDVFERNVKPPFNLTRPPRMVKRPDIPSEAYQLYDATMFYGKAVMTLLNTPGTDPENATQVISYIRSRSHDSIQGNQIWIHKNGESEGTYKVESLVFIEGQMSGPRLQEVGNFTSSSGNEPEYIPLHPVVWVNGHPPVSLPDCGYDGSLCPSVHLPLWKVASIIVGVLLFVLFVVIILILGIRHYMYEQKLERLAWKIERDDIQLLNAGQFMELTTPSRPRKKDSYSGNQLRTFLIAQESDPDIISDESCSPDDVPLGIYKGTNVAVRKLTRKNLELTRALKKQLQLRKELSHENINRFIGACIEVPHVYMVTQYCARKSLQDILQNEDSPLDNMFITSLVQDLIRGMSFIHDSEVGYHGNLKSSNCLVDSRWTLKISDFGLSALGFPDTVNFDDEESSKGLLWTAPELLRCRRRSSNSSSHPHHFYHGSLHNNNNNIKNNNKHSKELIMESQKGDVYSFAIVLYEIYGKSGPWGQTKLTNRQIIETLLTQTTPPLRPDTTSLTCDPNVINLIHACWDGDPDIRPDFKYGIRNRFKPIQQVFLKSNIFDNMLAMMEKYANNLEAVVAERTEQLRLEKKMTENLLLRMLPRSVAEKLKRGQRVEAEQFEQVSIYFSDIVGFTELSAESTPMEVVDLLNDLYTCFDSIIEVFDVYKVETIGDAYMVVSGLPIRNGDRHAGEIASMSLLLLEAIKNKRFRIRGKSNNMLKIRIGIHSGPCCAGVVGLKMPRYCLFGDTVNTASRLESTGEALKIHCSAECKKILDKLGGYNLEERGYTEMKGKGSLLTYFLMSEDLHQRNNRINNYKRLGSDGRCVSSSNLDYSGKIYSIGGKTLGYINVPNGKTSPVNNRKSSASLNTTSGSSWADASTVDAFHSHSSSASPHEFISSTLPRASNPKYCSPHMSPIAEDPSSFREWSLEKTISFPNSCLHDSNISEEDALLGSGVAVLDSLQHCDTHCQRVQRSRSLAGRSSRTHEWRMESFDEDGDNLNVEEWQDKMCAPGNSETVL